MTAYHETGVRIKSSELSFGIPLWSNISHELGHNDAGELMHGFEVMEQRHRLGFDTNSGF